MLTCQKHLTISVNRAMLSATLENGNAMTPKNVYVVCERRWDLVNYKPIRAYENLEQAHDSFHTNEQQHYIIVTVPFIPNEYDKAETFAP